MDDLQLSAPNITAAGLLSGVVLLVITGRLVPWWAVAERVKELLRQLDVMTKDRDYWRGTAERLQDAAMLQAQAQIEQLEMGRTQTHLLHEIQQAGRRAEPDEMAQADDDHRP